MDPRIAAVLDEALYRVVNGNGTARASQLKEVVFVGKTGTAQVATFVDKAHYSRQAKALKDHAWFVGYAPRENPQVAFAVIVENAGFGASSAAPVAAKLVKYWFVDRIKAPLPPPGNPIAAEPFHPGTEGDAP